jgi:hypothetical protein
MYRALYHQHGGCLFFSCRGSPSPLSPTCMKGHPPPRYPKGDPPSRFPARVYIGDYTSVITQKGIGRGDPLIANGRSTPPPCLSYVRGDPLWVGRGGYGFVPQCHVVSGELRSKKRHEHTSWITPFDVDPGSAAKGISFGGLPKNTQHDGKKDTPGTLRLSRAKNRANRITSKPGEVSQHSAEGLRLCRFFGN